jgi:hypothetical protein
MYQPLNGPAAQGSISVGITPVELKVGVTPASDRISITFQPVGGDIYYGYIPGIDTSTGFLVRSESVVFLEAGDTLPIYAVAASGTVNVRVAELQ